MNMDNFLAIDIIEGNEKVTEERGFEAWQHLVDNGVVWQLQGSYGRAASLLIEAGLINEAGE
jgi:hypothetical protein